MIKCFGDHHDFEARYDYQINDEALKIILSAWNDRPDDPISSLDALSKIVQERTYICDICRWCGQIVKRPKER